jgi:hypothetical protein
VLGLAFSPPPFCSDLGAIPYHVLGERRPCRGRGNGLQLKMRKKEENHRNIQDLREDTTERSLKTSRKDECDNPPRKIPYYRLNQSTLVIKQ